MKLSRNLVFAATIIVSVLGVLAARAIPQRMPDANDPVAREVREVRVAVDRAAATSAEASLLMARANAAQAQLTALHVEVGNVRIELARTSAEFVRATLRLRESELVAAASQRQTEWDNAVSDLRTLVSEAKNKAQ